MGQNFLAADREQALLFPPTVREWLPEGHFAWFVIDAVERIDLAAFMPPIEWTGTAGRRLSRR
jgi:hypothetical protein